MKICFHLCRYQNQHFSLVSRSCCSCSTRVELVTFVQQSFRTSCRVLLKLHWCCSCHTRVALVLLVSGTRVAKQASSRKSVTILGDSLLNGINEKGLSHKHRVKVVNKPGAPSERILEEIDDVIKSNRNIQLSMQERMT